jgi:hypothetical protein
VAGILASNSLICIEHSDILLTYTGLDENIRNLVLQQDALQAEIDRMQQLQKELKCRRRVMDTGIDKLFTHGAPCKKLPGRSNLLRSHFRRISNNMYEGAQSLLKELLTSVYLHEVAVLLFALMALRGQINDGDGESACMQHVNRELANAWALHLADPVLIRLFNEACEMTFYTLWSHKFPEIWNY